MKLRAAGLVRADYITTGQALARRVASSGAGRIGCVNNPADSAEPFFIDRGALKRNFGRAAATFGHGDALHREVARRMHERLDYIKVTPDRVLDLGCGPGADMGALAARYPTTRVTGVDIAQAMVRRAVPRTSLLKRWFGKPSSAVCADMAALPFADGSFGMIWSNLVLHWLDDPAQAIGEARRVLVSGGLFMFSTLGPDTLKELRSAFARADDGLHVKRFIDLHDIGDLLVATGFGTPVMDMEIITLTYESTERLFADLRATGSVNAMRGRKRGLTGRGVLARMRSALEVSRKAGRLPATFEVIYGHAWKAAPRPSAGAPAVIRFTPPRK